MKKIKAALSIFLALFCSWVLAAGVSGVPVRPPTWGPGTLTVQGWVGDGGVFNWNGYSVPNDGSLYGCGPAVAPDYGACRGLNVLQPLKAAYNNKKAAFNYLYQDGSDLFGMHMQVLGTFDDVAFSFQGYYDGSAWRSSNRTPFILRANDSTLSFKISGPAVTNGAASMTIGGTFTPNDWMIFDGSGITGSTLTRTRVTGVLGSTRGCSTGFGRVTPNYCRRSVYPTAAPFTDGACTSAAIPAGSNATDVLLTVDIAAVAANGVANRSATITTYTDATCTSASDTKGFSVREFNATAAGTAIGDQTLEIFAPVVSGNVYFKSTGSNAVGFPSYGFVGYHD